MNVISSIVHWNLFQLQSLSTDFPYLDSNRFWFSFVQGFQKQVPSPPLEDNLKDPLKQGSSFQLNSKNFNPVAWDPTVIFGKKTAPLSPQSTGVWLWESQWILNKEDRCEFFRTARAHGINSIYIGDYNLMLYHQKDLADFILQARWEGLGVELVLGDPSWAFAMDSPNGISYHEEALKAVDRVLKFLERYHLEGVGIQLDVEPHSAPEGYKGPRTWQVIAPQYLSLVDKVINRVGNRPLTLAFPLFLAESSITLGTETKKWGDHILDLADTLLIMAYSDNTASIKARTKPLLTYADTLHKQGQKNKRIILAMETQCENAMSGRPIPDHETFCQEGIEGLNTARETYRRFFEKSSSFGGTAIHAFASFRKMISKHP